MQLEQSFVEAYARLAVRTGTNVQEGQELYITSDIAAAGFAAECAAEAYRAGARFVFVRYRDDALTRARVENARGDLDYLRTFEIDGIIDMVRDGAAVLSIRGGDPHGLAGLDPQRMAMINRTVAQAGSPLRRMIQGNHSNWSINSLPTPEWASRVFPQESPERALLRLTELVRQACRLDTPDPAAAWDAHAIRLQAIASALTEEAFDSFHYQGPGTDLRVGMPANQNWIAAGESAQNGVRCLPNVPTEEVFSAPDWRRASGTLQSSRDFAISGTNVGIVTMRLEDGKIVEASATRDSDTLQTWLDLDDRARYFGEIAMVSQDSPLAQMGVVFHDPLYDENCGCHFAFGSAYPASIRGGNDMSEEQLIEAGLNVSKQHMDLTVGSAELSITGSRKGGEEVPIQKNGVWSDWLRKRIGEG